MKTIRRILIFLLFAIEVSVFAQQVKLANNDNQIKNVILLIPDGASTDLITLVRWYNNNRPLAVDSILCGMVKIHNIDNKFPDSAPTSTAYATGIKSNKKNIGMDSASIPHISVLELTRLKGLSTGVVVTCEFPHVTPADFVCHFNDRDNYKNLAKQFIYESPSIVFSGGEKVIDEYNYNELLEKENIRLITDIESFNRLTKLPEGKKCTWALFPDWKGGTNIKSYECDRNSNEPSLSEMTKKAIDILKQNEKGFFLMVEGSQID